MKDKELLYFYLLPVLEFLTSVSPLETPLILTVIGHNNEIFTAFQYC